MKKCNNCGNIFKNSNKCPNCGLKSIDYEENLTWNNRYASEIMTQEEARDFFETDKY